MAHIREPCPKIELLRNNYHHKVRTALDTRGGIHSDSVVDIMWHYIIRSHNLMGY